MIINVTQNLGPEKVSHLGFCHVIEILSQFDSEPSQNLMHMPSRDNISFDDFLGHLGEPPVFDRFLTIF